MTIGLTIFSAFVLLFILFKKGADCSWLTSMITSLVLSLGGFGLYSVWGSLHLVNTQKSYEYLMQTLADLKDMPELTEKDVSEALAKAEQSIEPHPMLWEKMGQIYQSLSWHDKSVESLEKAYDLNPNDVDLMRQLAYARSMLNRGKIEENDLMLITKILSLNPDDAPTLNLLAMNAFQRGQYEAALDFWEDIQARTDAKGIGNEALNRAIYQSRLKLGLVQPVEIKADIQILDGVDTSELSQDTPVFVAVKSPEGGPPLAVKKLTLQALPTTITLDGSDTMMGAQLEQGTQVVILARIARSMDPIARPGDIEGVSEPIVLDTLNDAQIVIQTIRKGESHG